MLLLTISSVLVGLALIGLYRLEGRLGLGPLFAFVIACQAFQNFPVSTVSMDLLGRFPTSPGSVVLTSASLFAILLIYLEEGLGAARRLVYGILLANVILILLTMSTQWGLVSGRLQSLSPVSDLFQLFDLRAFVVGTLLIMGDALLLLAIHEVLRARVRWLPQGGRIALSLLTVLCFDAVVFVTAGLGQGPGGLLAGNLLGKLLAGSVYAALLTVFLSIDGEVEKIDTAEIRDPLAMFTQRERYQLLKQEKLRVEGNLRRLFESNVVGMHIRTADGRILSANDRFLEMIGYTRKELPLRWKDLTPPEWHAHDAAKTHEVVETGEGRFWEKEYCHKDGHRIPVLIAVTLMEGIESECLAVVVDLSRTRQAESALRASEQRYKSLFEEIPLMYFNLNEDGVIRSVNSHGAIELGYRQEDLIGRPVLSVFHPSDRAAVEQSLQAALADPDRVAKWEFRKLRKDGSILNVREAVRVVKGPAGESELLVVCEDITASKEAEQKLAEHQRMLRELGWTLASVEEQQRRRIAQGLHDDVGQNLAMVQLNLAKLLAREQNSDRAALVSETRDLVVRTMTTTRSLTFALTSQVLYELGLEAALKDLVERTEREHEVKIGFESSGTSDRVADERAAVLYRATRELIYNAVRHSEAENLAVELETSPDQILITVEDDGVGFESAGAGEGFSRQGGFGLFSVRDQMSRLGGRLVIDSRPGAGTRIEISAPREPRPIEGKKQ